MNMKDRIERLEGASTESIVCQCLDAVAYVGTEYFSKCKQCGKTIDFETWTTWTVNLPTTATE